MTNIFEGNIKGGADENFEIYYGLVFKQFYIVQIDMKELYMICMSYTGDRNFSEKEREREIVCLCVCL